MPSDRAARTGVRLCRAETIRLRSHSESTGSSAVLVTTALTLRPGSRRGTRSAFLQSEHRQERFTASRPTSRVPNPPQPELQPGGAGELEVLHADLVEA